MSASSTRATRSRVKSSRPKAEDGIRTTQPSREVMVTAKIKAKVKTKLVRMVLAMMWKSGGEGLLAWM